MFCKFCGNKIVPNAFSKCTFCGARIDLSDGGQSFFKDAEIETWKNSGLSNGPNTGMPRTEIKEFPEEKKAISKSAQKEDKLNPIPSKLSLMWIAGTIAFVLLLFGVVANLPKDKKQDEDVHSSKEKTIVRAIEYVNKKLQDHNTETPEETPEETQKLLKTYSGEDVMIVEDGIALFNVKKFLWEEKDYKHEGPDASDKTITKYEDRSNPEKIVIGVKRDTDKVYVDGKPHTMRTKNVLKEEIFFVDAATFLEVAFGYRCEYDPNTQTLKIYG